MLKKLQIGLRISWKIAYLGLRCACRRHLWPLAEIFLIPNQVTFAFSNMYQILSNSNNKCSKQTSMICFVIFFEKLHGPHQSWTNQFSVPFNYNPLSIICNYVKNNTNAIKMMKNKHATFFTLGWAFPRNGLGSEFTGSRLDV